MRRRIWLVWVMLALAVPAVSAGMVAAAPARVAYIVMVDIVRGSFEPTGTVCVQTSVFKQGEEVVWRARVIETGSGREIGGDGKNQAEIAERNLKATAYLENGMNFPLKYGQHPPRPREGDPVKWFWTVSWKISPDYPTGTLKWWVVVTDKAGAFVRFDPIGAGTNLPAPRIIIEKR